MPSRAMSCRLVSSRQSEPKDGLLSPVLSASDLPDDGRSVEGKRYFGRNEGDGGQAPVSGTAFHKAYHSAAARAGPGGGPAGGRGGGGGAGVVGEAKSAMYEAFKQVRG